jgi:hypothetical protein
MQHQRQWSKHAAKYAGNSRVTGKMPAKTSATLTTLGLVLAQSLAWAIDSQQFSALLRQQASANERDLKLYAAGVFAKILPHARKGEVAAVGAVRIPVTIDFFLDRVRDIENFKKGPEVLNIGKFSDPPREQNLGKLTLGDDALSALAGCRPGKCSLKLSVEMMNRLRSSAASLGRGQALESEFRSVLLGYLSSYRERGTPAMITYSDTEPPVETSREFLQMLGQFAWLQQYAPLLYETLKASLRTEHPEMDEFFYWSKESFGLKPVVSVTHVVILKTTIEGQPWAFIASKQIYADHYFEASLGLTVLAGESTNPGDTQTSVAYFNRSQTDGLRGWFAAIERSIVERRVRTSMAKNLSEMKDRLGKAYREQAP